MKILLSKTILGFAILVFAQCSDSSEPAPYDPGPKGPKPDGHIAFGIGSVQPVGQGKPDIVHKIFVDDLAVGTLPNAVTNPYYLSCSSQSERVLSVDLRPGDHYFQMEDWQGTSMIYKSNKVSFTIESSRCITRTL